jgi:pimeloyl-ACP methyl ester carboxylesterase
MDCFNKVIPPLQADGHEVIAVQYGLDTFAEDVATVKRTLGRVSSPVILVGHSYGGATITAAGMDERVKGLVYIAAVAHDTGETVQGQLDKYPTEIFNHIAVADGRVWLLPPEGTPTTRQPPTYSSNNKRSMATHGSRNQAGSSSPRLTGPCIPTSSAFWRSVWGRPPSRRTAATSSCSPSPTSSLT